MPAGGAHKNRGSVGTWVEHFIELPEGKDLGGGGGLLPLGG